MSKLEIALACWAAFGTFCSALAAVLPPSKAQHWLAWAGNFASKKPLLPEAPAPKADA